MLIYERLAESNRLVTNDRKGRRCRFGRKQGKPLRVRQKKSRRRSADKRCDCIHEAAPDGQILLAGDGRRAVCQWQLSAQDVQTPYGIHAAGLSSSYPVRVREGAAHQHKPKRIRNRRSGRVRFFLPFFPHLQKDGRLHAHGIPHESSGNIIVTHKQKHLLSGRNPEIFMVFSEGGLGENTL